MNRTKFDFTSACYAVQWLDSHVWQQERPLNVDTAADFWAQTYVAGHHNSTEESIVDKPRAR